MSTVKRQGMEDFPRLTRAEFKEVLDELRPAPSRVEVVYQRGELKDEVGALIYLDGKLKHVIEVERQNAQDFEEQVEDLVSFYRHPPMLWPGCRGALARKYGLVMTTEFNLWFDRLANAAKE